MGSIECQSGVEMGGWWKSMGRGRLSPGGRGGGCDCGALRKVRLTLQRLQHVCKARRGVAKELKLLSLQLGQG